MNDHCKGFFFGLSPFAYPIRSGSDLPRSLGLLLFENRLLIRKDLGPILATAAFSSTLTIGTPRGGRAREWAVLPVRVWLIPSQRGS